MFGLGMPEILLILAIALIVIGPKKLPELAKTLGRAMGEFKRSAQDFKRSIDVETTVKNSIKDIDPPPAEKDLKDVIKDANEETPDKTDAVDEDQGETKESSTDDKADKNNQPAPDEDKRPDATFSSDNDKSVEK